MYHADKNAVSEIFTFVKYNFTFFRAFWIRVQDAFERQVEPHGLHVFLSRLQSRSSILFHFKHRMNHSNVLSGKKVVL